VLLSASLAVAGCSGSSGGSAGSPAGRGSASSTAASAVKTVPLPERQIARFRLTGQPDYLGSDAAYVYVKEDSGEVVAIDPRSNRVAWRLSPATDLCQGLGVGFGSVWTCAPSQTDDTDDVVRIDSRTHRVVATLKVGKSSRQGHLVTGMGRVWVINSSPAGSTLVGIDPVTNKSDPPIPLGMLATELTIDDKLVWAVGSATGQVVGVDPRQRKVVRRIDGLGRLGGPSAITVGGGTLLWVSGDDATAGIDRDSGRVVVEVAQGTKGFGGLFATKTDLWLHSGEPFLIRIDPATGRASERIVAPDLPNPGDVLFAFGSLWASASNQSTLVRLRA
jgi:hypothetical protein